MNQKDHQPNDEGERVAGDGQQNQPAERAQRIQKLAIIFPADDAGVYRPFIHFAPVRIRNPTAQHDRPHWRQCHSWLLLKRFLIHNIWHLGRVAAVVPFQHVDQRLSRAPSHAFVGIDREPRDLRATGEVMK